MGCASSRATNHVEANSTRGTRRFQVDRTPVLSSSSEERLTSHSVQRMMDRDPQYNTIGHYYSDDLGRGFLRHERRLARERRLRRSIPDDGERRRNSPHPAFRFTHAIQFASSETNNDRENPIENDVAALEFRSARNRDWDNDDPLEQVRSDLERFERAFERLLITQLDVHGTHADWVPRTTSSQSCPPASSSVLERLPIMKIIAQDFEDEPIKECCICFSEFQVGDEVCRLPCRHIFHKECVSEWLKKKCTCPQCRWELETEDETFERERLNRMKSRKLVVKDHELERLSIEGLQDMTGTMEVMDRKQLIETIHRLDHIDIVTTQSSSNTKFDT